MNNNPSKEEIINKAIKFHLQGNITEATKFYQYCINQGFNDHRIFSNYGAILQGLGKLKEAEFSYRKAIELKPDYAIAHSNLGNILRDLGKLKEAEISLRKAIIIKPDHAEAYYNLGIVLKNLGKLEEAEISYLKAIKIDPNFSEAYSNLGTVLYDLEKLKQAELSIHKAIELNPNNEIAHYNLGNIMRNIGKLKEAEISYLKALEINPNFSQAYFILSTLKLSNQNKLWQDQLFSQNLLDKKSKKDQINIYFARANIFHKESNFKESSKYLQLANNLKNQLYSSNVKYLINKSKELLLKSNKELFIENECTNFPQSIFIVGMPRSGSTLLESILSMNNNVNDLGEKDILEKSFLNWKTSVQKLTLADLYFKETSTYDDELRSTTNKWLYNYQFTGIISTQIPNSKIIHCFRNPLDNILSIFRANFAKGNEYSSSLVDCAKVYLDQEELMSNYKHRFRSKIYDLNYDSLVSNPNQEIKSLISWLGWKWEDKYLSPHLNPRSVSTASAIQVRSPINTKSLGVWKNYKEMLRPAMEIITQKDKYKDLKY